MPDLVQWIKDNAKDDANVEEGLQLVKDLDPLKNLDSREAVVDFMRRNDRFRSALDHEVQQAVESNSKRFAETKLPEILKTEREKLMKELNPEETPEQKQLRELQEKLAERDRKEARRELEAQLRTKAQEIGFDPVRAERYAAFGDEAMTALESDAQWFDEAMKSKVDEAMKSRYSTTTPKGGNSPTGKTVTRTELQAMSPAEQMKLMRSGEVSVVDDPA